MACEAMKAGSGSMKVVYKTAISPVDVHFSFLAMHALLRCTIALARAMQF